MPSKPSDYASQGGARRLQTVVNTGTVPADTTTPLQFQNETVKTETPEVNNDMSKFTSDQPSFTGKNQGFFSKFGSNKVK